MAAIFLLPLAACSTVPPATPTSCVSATDLAPEPRLARSKGGALGRAELLEDDSRAREAHEALRAKWNRLVEEFTGC
jgi:hypothetical protein